MIEILRSAAARAKAERDPMHVYRLWVNGLQLTIEGAEFLRSEMPNNWGGAAKDVKKTREKNEGLAKFHPFAWVYQGGASPLPAGQSHRDLDLLQLGQLA